MTHTDAINKVLLFTSSLGWLMARRDVGLFMDMRGCKRFIGVNGEADTQGTAPGGISVAIEVKTGSGTLTADQKAWRDAFIARGGRYAVARPDRDGWEDDVRGIVG